MSQELKQPTLDQAVHEAYRDLTRNNPGCEKDIEEVIAKLIISTNRQIEHGGGIVLLVENESLVCDVIEVVCAQLPQGVQQKANQIRRRIQAQLKSGELEWGHLTHPAYTVLTNEDIAVLVAGSERVKAWADGRELAPPEFSRFIAQTTNELAMQYASTDTELATALASVGADASRDFIVGKVQTLMRELAEMDKRHETAEKIWTTCIDGLEEIILAPDAHDMASRAIFSVLLEDMSRRLQNDVRMTDQSAKDHLKERLAALSEKIETSIQ